MKVIFAAALLLFGATTYAVDDSSYYDYLSNKGLTATKCTERSPRDLFGWVQERERVDYIGTPSHEQRTIDAFDKRFLQALQPHVDATVPDAAAARQELHAVLYLIADFYANLTRARTYVTHERCDTYSEHLLLVLSDLRGARIAASATVNPSMGDVIRFARAKGAMKQGGGVPADFDGFSAKLQTSLAALERALPAVDASSIRLLMMDFADIHEELLNPNVYQRFSG